jgi:light-regulated signal transduction histidine kinase (bacteriophytochrome)
MQTTRAADLTVPATRAKRRSEPDYVHDVLMQLPALVCVTRGPRHVIAILNELYSQSIGGLDVAGQTMREAFPGASAASLAALDKVYRTGTPHHAREVRLAFAGGGNEEQSFNLTVQPLKRTDGAVYGLMLHAVDVTDAARTRQELADLAFALERTNRELDTFAYAASHDLRAPLRGIANLAQWIEEDLLASDQLKDETYEMLELMRLRMHRMEGLIEGLLQYSRAGRVHQGVEAVNVGQLIRVVVDLLSPPQGVTIAIAPDLPTITTERLLLQQVFLNLLNNAIKHCGRDTCAIEVSGRRLGPFYEFWVKDDGPGIAPEFHDRIWGIFQTLEDRDSVEGAGIGLALVKKIVESQRGRVWVESVAGEGATFKFLWPKQS